MPLVTPQDIARMSRELSTVAASPAFLDLIRSIHDAPESETLATAKSVADVGMLRRHGITPPADFRITTRTFEDPGAIAATSGMPELVCESDRVVFTFGNVVTVVEVVHDGD